MCTCGILVSVNYVHRGNTGMIPTLTGNLENWEGIFQSGNFEQTGKVLANLYFYFSLIF